MEFVVPGVRMAVTVLRVAMNGRGAFKSMPLNCNVSEGTSVMTIVLLEGLDDSFQLRDGSHSFPQHRRVSVAVNGTVDKSQSMKAVVLLQFSPAVVEPP
jgi:hypothetical protein